MWVTAIQYFQNIATSWGWLGMQGYLEGILWISSDMEWLKDFLGFEIFNSWTFWENLWVLCF